MRLPKYLIVIIQFVRFQQRLPNIRHPKTFSDHVQRRKIYNRDPRFKDFADKVRVKEIVSRMIGEEWIIPTLWSGVELPSVLPWPTPFVLKANHACGWNYFVRSLESENLDRLSIMTKGWMKTSWCPDLVEDHYNEIDRRILAEPMIGENLTDLKFFVFGGRVEFIQVDTGRYSDPKRSFYDRSWRRQAFSIRYPYQEGDPTASPPIHLEQMIEAAETLGGLFDFARVDLYDLETGPKFGEVTFTPGSGFVRFFPQDIDNRFGALWTDAQKRLSKKERVGVQSKR